MGGAEILSIIAALMSLVAGVLEAVGDAAILGAGIIVIIAGILMIVASVINIIGVSKASRDEASFKKALIALFVGIAANALVTSSSSNSLLGDLGGLVGNITEILASFFICTGIIMLADRLIDPDVSARGKRVRSLLIYSWLASAVLNLLSTIFSKNQGMQTAVGIISIIGGIVSVIAYVLYIGLLSRAKKMLAK